MQFTLITNVQDKSNIEGCSQDKQQHLSYDT
jgi:hypothetical protein